MDLLEKLLNKKSKEKLDQLRKENEKLKEYQIGSSLEIKNLTDENDKLKKETNRLLKLSEESSEKLKEKIAEYELLVDKNNYINANLLNSTAVNSSINVKNHTYIISKKLAKFTESEISCSIRSEGDDDKEEESDNTDEEDETEVEETQTDATEIEETIDQSNHKLINFSDQHTQTESVATRSIEVEVLILN